MDPSMNATYYADGFDDAILGLVEPMNRPPLVVYDRIRCIELLMEQNDWSHEDAEEYFSFNVEGAYVGPGTPLYLERLTKDEIDLRLEDW